MTTNAEMLATYHDGRLDVHYDLGNRCFDCGEPTPKTTGRLIERIPGLWEIMTNEDKLVIVDGYWCETCQLADTK